MNNEFQFRNHMESRRHKMNHPMGRNSMDDEDMWWSRKAFTNL